MRTFISKRKQEHEEKLSKKKKNGPKVSGETIVEPEAQTDAIIADGKSNGDCDPSEEISPEPEAQTDTIVHGGSSNGNHSISEDPASNHEKGRGDLKPARVLEVTD